MSVSTSLTLTSMKAGLRACVLGSVLLATIRPGWSQTATGDPLPKSPVTERQTQQNPAPKVHGNNQNRGRMTADYLWGIVNGNKSFLEVPYSRLPDQTTQAPLQDDGWTFPYPVGADGRRVNMNRAPVSSFLYSTLLVDNEALAPAVVNVGLPIAPGGLGTSGGVLPGASWTLVGGPSTDFIGNGYHRAAATIRSVGQGTTAAADPTKFSWYPSVPGAAGTFRRYAIRVHIPTLDPAVLAGTTPVENRITDARYIVYYAVPDTNNGGFFQKRKVCFLAQDAAGDFYLTGSDGRPAYFPFLSEVTYGSGGSYRNGGLYSDIDARARVELDTTTENQGDSLFVIADRVEFLERPVTIKAAPIVTPPHGGRKIDTAQSTATNPYQQPAARATTGINIGGVTYGRNQANIAGTLAFLNDSFDFINNPRDPIYDPADPLYNATIPFDPSNPSTLFSGPASLIAPRATPLTPSAPAQQDPWNGVGVSTIPVNAQNFMVYQRRITATTNEAVPFFSHMQVLVAKTEYIVDPETNVSAADRDGTLTQEVGYVEAYDWLTSTPIWRFPDRSYLPADRRQPGFPAQVIPGAGFRNPQVGTVPQTNPAQPVFQIPGIDFVDKDGNGLVSDDEVFIVGQGNNAGGGLGGAITLAPNMVVRGVVNVPTYNATSLAMTGTATAPIGRYLKVDATAPGGYGPIQMPLAYFGSNNGVIYAIDPFGNNDNVYFENTADTTRLGTFRPGTTNLLWTFGTLSAPRKIVGAGAETLERYYRRLKTEVPETGAFAGSSPVVTWSKSEDDATLNTLIDEPRLFIGNQNGVLYALDPRANAGSDISTGVPLALPIRKGEQTYNALYTMGYPETLASLHRTELKWWFETLGSINTTAATSAFAFPRAAAAGIPESKGVYATTGEGRVYCFDWHGPVTKADHELNMVWNGTAGDALSGTVADPPPVGSAAALNDNIKFRNDIPARVGARPDFTEGTIRPRWTFPNRYRDIDAARTRTTDTIDFSQAFPGRRLAEPFTNISGILSAPVLMDFPYNDPDIPALSGIRRYVVVSTNDYNSDAPDAPIQGRLFLLDQEGNRLDFLSNPTPSRSTAAAIAPLKPTPAIGAVITDQPLDQFISKIGPFGAAAPTWTYRAVYDRYDASNLPIIQDRNQPVAANIVNPANEPAKRILPTVFVGGVGRLYAIDLDPDSGLLARWRNGTNGDLTLQLQAMPEDYIIPGADAQADWVNPSDTNNPASTIFNVGAKISRNLRATNRILARTIRFRNDASPIDGNLVVSGGPTQNRNNATADVAGSLPAALAAFTVLPTVDATHPSVPPIPTDDTPSQKPVFTLSVAAPVGFGYNLAPIAPLVPVLPIFDFTGRYVNQESDDPLATSRGTSVEGVSPAPGLRNVAYQFPTLFASTQGGFIHQVSTKIDGEDPTYAGQFGSAANATYSLGWALVEGDQDRFDEPHNLLWSVRGPGGSGSGLAIVTNAFFPGRDPDFARRADRRAKLATDPSLDFPFYPWGEPNVASSTTRGVTDYSDDPRPNFKPRPLSPGDSVNFPTILPDTHTGMTGFPLNLQGLFYDKQFAFARDAGGLPIAPAQDTTNADAEHHNRKFALPGYTEQGTRNGNTVVTGSVVSDFERLALNVANQTTFDPRLANEGDNVNPAGQNVAWIFAGGDDGVLYGYTPVFAQRLGGVGSGLVGGQRNRSPDAFSGQLKIDIFDPQDFNVLRAAAASGNPRRPARTSAEAGFPLTDNVLSRAAKGRKNYFEWGETVDVIVWDINVVAPYDASQPAPPTPNTLNVILTLTAEEGGQTITRNFPLEQFGAVVATYPYDGSYNFPPRATPTGLNPAQLGIAFARLQLTPESGLPLSPGTRIRISAIAQPPAGTNPNDIIGLAGGNGSEIGLLRNTQPVFTVANPLAVQGFLADTTPGAVPTLVRKDFADPIAGGIGPFRTQPRFAPTDTVKNRVAATGRTDGSLDPDRNNSEYSQALSNGNLIRRFDLDPYILSGGNLDRNPNYGRRLRDENGGDDPNFYIPVVAGAGYIGHGRTGSTDLSDNQRNLRVANRSLMQNLRRVRVEVMDDLTFRWWPGTIPNADVDDSNLRRTPVGMGSDGRINPLPWETPVNEPQPWKRRAQTAAAGTILARGNISPDYPDIPAISGSVAGRQAINVLLAGSDATLGPVQLPEAQFDTAPEPAAMIAPLTPNAGVFGATVNVRVPRFQPANLVANHSLTSTYESPSTADGAQPFVGDGAVQLPRGINNRQLETLQLPYATGNKPQFLGGATIVPFGYTTRLRVFVDSDNNGSWTAGNNSEPYRIVEIWTGVPVDMGLRSADSPVDLGALPAGFGVQNGLLGYANGNPGFLPEPVGMPYKPFFKRFTIQNTGNVNLWNLRASQKVEYPLFPVIAGRNPVGSGGSFFYFGLQSTTVDPRFGILAVGADPNASAPVNNLFPQIVTSLDPTFDGGWDAYYQTQPWMNIVTDNGQTIYQRFYRPFAGRHTFGKARPGAPTPTTLGLPDLPVSQTLVPVDQNQPQPFTPLVGVAVPVGTPAGIYQSRFSAKAGGPPMLSVFEDHDTNPNAAYQATPILVGGVIQPAGPTYGGFNSIDDTVNPLPGTRPIFPAGSNSVLRIRAVTQTAAVQQTAEYQPHTAPAIDLKVTVAETPITGQIPDYTLSAFGIDTVFSGLLPGVDRLTIAEGTLPLVRPAAAVSPAAYRSSDGRLNVYFVRNATAAGVAQTGAGAPFRLFHTHMNWDANLGTFVASNPGVPIANPNANQGTWFTSPVEIAAAAAPSDSNISPSVMQATNPITGQVLGQNALLTFVNSRLVPGSTPVDTLYWSRLDANGQPVGASEWFVNGDPSVRRINPKAVYEPANSTTIAFYHGGVPGKWNLYYSGRNATNEGIPSGATPDGSNRRLVETVLPLPPAIVSAYDVTTIARRLYSVDNTLQTSVIDVYYTGVLKTDPTPDLYMTRFTVVPGTSGSRTRLAPVTLPAVTNERLVQNGRELVWQARHISWVRNIAAAAVIPNVPEINVQPVGSPAWATVANRWQFDDATQLLYQVVSRPGGLIYVYVDTASGTVRFRGVDTPTTNAIVRATYQPQTYRLTLDGASDGSPHTFVDNRVLPAGTGVVGNVVKRSANLTTGRQYLLWQKGAQSNRPATLFYSARRVGIDLKSFSLPAGQGMTQNESIKLSPANGAGLQIPQVSNVRLSDGTVIAFEVDYVKGRIYIDSTFEGATVLLDYIATSGAPATERTIGVTGVLALPIEELGATDAPSIGLQVPMQRPVNEGQVYGFLDLFVPNSLNRPNGPAPVDGSGNILDPTLSPGRVWMFWVSSRSRVGLVESFGNLIAVPSGFDLFYQTIAPNFDVPSSAGVPTP